MLFSNAKNFINESVLYIKDNNKLIQESFNRSVSAIHLSSKTGIRDFMVDENFNYYVLHNKCTISKFTKDNPRNEDLEEILNKNIIFLPIKFGTGL